jgi:hypothetical protein
LLHKDDEKAKEKREERQRIFDMLNNQAAGKGRVKVTKFGKFRGIARGLWALLWLRKVAIQAKKKIREEKLKDLDDAIKLYTDVTKGWLSAAIKRPILSMVSEPDLDFNFFDMAVDESIRENRLMKLKVRAKGVI